MIDLNKPEVVWFSQRTAYTFWYLINKALFGALSSTGKPVVEFLLPSWNGVGDCL
jgi:hypothetical protein